MKKKVDISREMIFEGGIQSHTRCILVKEFIKYILYERQQIPVPYEQVKQGFKSTESHQLDSQVLLSDYTFDMKNHQHLMLRLIKKLHLVLLHGVVTMYTACS